MIPIKSIIEVSLPNVLRLGVTVFVFLKRKMEWSEMFIATCLMSFVLFSFAKVGGSGNKSVGTLDYLSLRWGGHVQLKLQRQ